jgi:hypothetical protein
MIVEFHLSNEENQDIRVKAYHPDCDSWLTITFSSDGSSARLYMSEQQARDIVTALSDGLRELESQRVIPEPELMPTCVHCYSPLEAHPASSGARDGWWAHAITADDRQHGVFHSWQKDYVAHARLQTPLTAAQWLAAHPEQVAE